MGLYYFAPFRDNELDFEPTDRDHMIGFTLDDNWMWRLCWMGSSDQLAIEAHSATGHLWLYSKRDSTLNPSMLGPDTLAWLIKSFLSEKCTTIVIQACDSLDFGKRFKEYLGQNNTREVWAANETIAHRRWNSPNERAFYTKL